MPSKPELWNIVAGDLDRRVTIQAKATDVAPDTRGRTVRRWNDKLKVWAKVETLAGRKGEIARQLVATATHLITMRFRELDEKDNRITYLGRVFTINHQNNVEEKRVRLELTCTEEIGEQV